MLFYIVNSHGYFQSPPLYVFCLKYLFAIVLYEEESARLCVTENKTFTKNRGFKYCFS